MDEGPGPAGAALLHLNQQEALYDEGKSLKELFGDLDGAMLVEAIFTTYGDGSGSSNSINATWYSSTGDRNIVKHAENRSIAEAVCDRYRMRILESGLQIDVAGAPWMVWSAGRTFPLRAITFNHRAESFYRACEDDPGNQYVQAGLKQGLSNIRMLNAKTPRFAIRFLMNYHNSFHGGSGATFIELGEEALSIELAWKSHASDIGLTSRSDDYEKKYGEYVKESSVNFHSWKPFDSTKAWVHNMQTYGQWSNFKMWATKHVDFLDTTFDNMNAISLMHAMSVVIIGSTKHYATKLEVGILLYEAMKFCVPSRSFGAERPLPWLFQRPAADKISQMGMLGTDMATSAILKKAAKTAEQGKEKNEGATEKQLVKRRRRADPASGSAPQLSPPVSSMMNPTEGSESQGSRMLTWIDDLLLCMREAMDKDAKPEAFESINKTRQFVCSLALEFLWEAQVAVNGKLFKAWSRLRPDLQQILRITHSMCFSTTGETAAVPESAADLAARLLKIVSNPIQMVVEGDDVEEARVRLAEHVIAAGAAQMKGFIDDMLHLPLTLHDGMTQALRTIHNSSDKLKACQKLSTVLEIIGGAVFASVPPSWIAFGQDASIVMGAKGLLPESLQPIVGSVRNLEKVMALRPMYAVHLLNVVFGMRIINTTAIEGMAKAEDLIKLLHADMSNEMPERHSAWAMLTTFDSILLGECEPWAKSWAQVLKAKSLQDLKQVAAKLAGMDCKEAEATETGLNANVSPRKLVEDMAARHQPSASTSYSQESDITKLTFGDIYHFADGPGLLHESQHAKDLGITDLTVVHLQVLERNLEAFLWKRYVQLFTPSLKSCMADLTQKKDRRV